jgi:hypothetical protein
VRLPVSDLERGTLVQHATLGLGKVVALESDAVHVFFPGRGERFAAKLRLPGARAFLRVGVEDRNAWLEGLSSFTLDAASGRWALPARWLTLDQAVSQFLGGQPKGFSASPRAATWRAAQQLFADTLGAGEAERLLDAGDVREVVKRVLKVGRLVSPLHGEDERDAVEDAFGDDDATRRFLRALFDLLAVPSPGRPRFDRLYGVAAGLPGTPEAHWLLVTLFPFLGRPDRHPLLRPGSTREAAERLGFDLRFDDAPNWNTFAALRAHSTRLLEALAPSGARDFIDVEVFAHAASTMRAGGKRAKREPKVAAAPAAPPSPAPRSAKGAPGKPAPKPAPKVAAKAAAKAPARAPAKKVVAKPARAAAKVVRRATRASTVSRRSR